MVYIASSRTVRTIERDPDFKNNYFKFFFNKLLLMFIKDILQIKDILYSLSHNIVFSSYQLSNLLLE